MDFRKVRHFCRQRLAPESNRRKGVVVARSFRRNARLPSKRGVVAEGTSVAGLAVVEQLREVV